MNFKTSLAGLIALAPALSFGQANLSFSDRKEYKQIGDRENIFVGGSLSLTLDDGSVAIAPCADNGSPVRVTPYIFCQLGTQGLVTAGDIDGDGVNDVANYFSIAQIIAALNVDPFQTNRIRMIAAPPSQLGRPLGGTGWLDQSIVVYFDQINFPVRGYDITSYTSSRDYLANELDKQFDEIVPGTYIFEFPRLGDELNPYPIRISHLQMMEAWPGRGQVAGPNEFTMLHDGEWTGGELEIDPRVFYTFRWRGFNGNSVLASDSLTFSMVSRENIPVQGLIYPPGTVIFPPYGPFVPDNERVPELIPSLRNQYELGPFLYQIGDAATARLIMSRNLRSTGNSTDNSVRTYTWDVNFVDTFDGFLVDALRNGTIPTTADEQFLEPDADYDGDGFSNIEEFALQTDPADPASVPVIDPVLDPLTQQCLLTIPKRPSVGDRLQYQVEYTTDFNTWTTIEDGDPNWFITLDDDNTYEVLSREPVPAASCLVRVRITQL